MYKNQITYIAIYEGVEYKSLNRMEKTSSCTF